MFGHTERVTLGPYAIDRPLGSGAMGVVYLAHDPRLDRPVALKVLHPQRCVLESERGHRQLRREGRALGRIVHDNVVTVYDVGEANGRIYVAMQYVEGRSLQDWLEQEPRDWAAVRDAFVQAGRGLAAAHDAGIAHRDFKPSNVQVGDDGHVRVLDFGLATGRITPTTSASGQRSSQAGEHVSATDGRIAGTPHYMAPELRQGAPADPRSDQYAYCVALHDALAAVHDDVPRRVRRIVDRGRSPDPRARHPSMAALLAELQRPASRRRVGVLGAVVLLTGLGLTAAGSSASIGVPAHASAGSASRSASRSESMSESMRSTLADLEDLLARHDYATVAARARALSETPWAEHAGFWCELHLDLASAEANLGNLDEAKRLATAVYERAAADDLSFSRVAAPLLLAQFELQRPVDADAAAHWVSTARSVGTALDELPEQAFRLEKLDVEIAAVRDPSTVIDEGNEAVAFASARWGPQGHNTAVALVTLAREQLWQQQADAARASVTRALDIERAQTMPDPLWLAAAEALRARISLMQAGLTPDQAPALWNDALSNSRHAEALYAGTTGPDSRWTLGQRVDTATVLVYAGRLGEAQAELEALLPRLEDRKMEGPALEMLGRVQRERGQLDRATATLQRVVLHYETVYGPDHPGLLNPLHELGEAQRAAEQLDLARKTHDRALALAPAVGPGAHASALETLAWLETDAGDHAAAERRYREAIPLWAEVAGPESTQVRNVRAAIEALDRPSPAAGGAG